MCLCVCVEVFEESLKAWLEKQKIIESSLSSNVSQHDVLTTAENNILLQFVDVTESLIRRSQL